MKCHLLSIQPCEPDACLCQWIQDKYSFQHPVMPLVSQAFLLHFVRVPTGEPRGMYMYAFGSHFYNSAFSLRGSSRKLYVFVSVLYHCWVTVLLCGCAVLGSPFLLSLNIPLGSSSGPFLNEASVHILIHIFMKPNIYFCWLCSHKWNCGW